MRDDGRMSSQVDYTRDSVNDMLAGATDQPVMYRSRNGEESRSRGGNTRDTTSPPAASNSSSSNGHSSKDASAQRRESAPAASSPSFFAPPSTPSPHYGFRRNTANTMAAGRRVSHRGSSAPGPGGDGRGAELDTLSPTAEESQLPSPRLSSASVAGTGSYLNDVTSRLSRDGRKGSGGGADSGGNTRSTAPGTLPSSNGHTFKYSNLRKFGGERFFQIDDDEVAAALLGEAPPTATEVDRQTGYRYPALGSKARSGSAPTVAEAASSSPQLLSPNLTLLNAEAPPATAAANAEVLAPLPNEPKPRREKKSGKEEKKRRHHSSRRSRTSSSGAGSRAGNSDAAPQPMASSSSSWFAGMTAAQQNRFEDLQARSSAGHEMARWKMMELMRHWMSAQGTRSSVDAVIRGVLVDAGLAKVKEAWGSGTGVSGQRPSLPSPQLSKDGEEAGAPPSGAALDAAATAMAASPPTSEPPPDKVSPKNQLMSRTAAGATPDDATPPAQSQTTPPALADAGEIAGDRAKKVGLRTAGDEASADPSSLPALVEVATGNASGAPATSTGDTESTDFTNSQPALQVAAQLSVSPHRRLHKKDKAAAATTKEEKREQQEQQQTSSAVEAAPSKGDDEANGKKAEGTKGELPTVNAIPEKYTSPGQHNGSGGSPETADAVMKTDASADRANTAKPFCESTTLQRTPSETSLQSPRASDAVFPRSRSRSNSLKEVAAKRHTATYEEIPRFYFPLGRPVTREQVINGPLSRNHENPHLKVVDGVAIAAPMYDGEESNVLGANAGALVGGSGEEAEVTIEARRGPKVAPMSNLHALDDRQVAHYLQREFGRLPPFPKHSSRVRLLGGRARNGSHHNSNLPYAKQELIYKQQFIQCVQRVCSQCFGVPRYFAFIVLRLIQWEVNNGAVDPSVDGNRPQTRHTSSSRMGSSSSLLSHTTTGSSGNGSGTLPSFFHITAQHLKDFYDTHLRSKDPVRRVFDLLVLSSRLPNSAAAAASLAVTNAAAAATTAAADGSTEGSTPRNLGDASLRSYLLPQDFVAYIDTLLTQHPGLTFLRQTPDFQTKYLDTVIYRIYYELDRFDRGCISYSELAASRLIDAFRQVDAAEDINSVLLFFSYEHFYVLYCRFWELDEDRDMLLAPEDFMRYAPEDVMNPVIVQRVFAGVGRRLRCTVPQRIGYEDFVWFCLSEEDKSTPQAIRYWFRVLDLDGDGVLSMYELRKFYDATRDKIAQYVQEGLVTFEDVACQVFDMMRCPECRGLYLSDLLHEPEAAAVALNMLTNVVKFLQFEQRDPFVSHQERLLGGLEQSAWDRFARLEYDRMALETDEDG
jgi:serine/threonine-protein phosphatase 2A regulatory subunit B''